MRTLRKGLVHALQRARSPVPLVLGLVVGLAWASHVLLDLGEVREMAEVRVNGQGAEILWKPPFRTDITPLVRAGENRLEILVTNLWVNRLIGDKQPGATPVAFVTIPTYKPDAPLRPLGADRPGDARRSGGVMKVREPPDRPVR